MSTIEEAVKSVLLEQKERLTGLTFASRRCYLNRLLETASEAGIGSPCQELYDLFAADDYGSKERRFHLDHCIKLVDKHAGTHAIKQDGKLYNEPILPSIEDARVALGGVSYPAESLDIGLLIIKAGLEMEHLELTASTIGQYKHAWRDILCYFFLRGLTQYDENTMLKFVDQATSLRDCGQMKEWKWKINRKAAHTLIEVAGTGGFEWSKLCQDLRFSDDGLEEVRSVYLASLRERNLQPKTIYLYDYVFRSALRYARIVSLSELKSLSADHVQRMTAGISSTSSKRSLATILPVLRSVLEFLHVKGYVESCFSGMVMGAFVQRGNVAAYISPNDEKKIIGELERGSKRDKAIFLLLLRLGLRECDICDLTLQEIEWENDRINLAQKKTGRLLVLPLLPDVGNALMDYIASERPVRGDGDPYVFLRKQAPHNKLASLYHLCSSMAKRLDIVPINGHTVGAHLYRYTLVHRLLSAQAPHQVITDILGHASKESDKPCLSMDESMLRLCPLDLSIMGGIRWKQGAGNG